MDIFVYKPDPCTTISHICVCNTHICIYIYEFICALQSSHIFSGIIFESSSRFSYFKHQRRPITPTISGLGWWWTRTSRRSSAASRPLRGRPATTPALAPQRGTWGRWRWGPWRLSWRSPWLGRRWQFFLWDGRVYGNIGNGRLWDIGAGRRDIFHDAGNIFLISWDKEAFYVEILLGYCGMSNFGIWVCHDPEMEYSTI